MHLRGIIQSASLEENPPGSDTIEMIVKVQGVGPGQPRKVVIPYQVLLEDHTLEPDSVEGHAFEADIDPDPADGSRWLVSRIAFASRRVLRPKD